MLRILSQLGPRKVKARIIPTSTAHTFAAEGGPLSLSFAGCAWLFPYHLGAIEAFRKESAFDSALYLGASSGSLAFSITVPSTIARAPVAPLSTANAWSLTVTRNVR